MMLEIIRGLINTVLLGGSALLVVFSIYLLSLIEWILPVKKWRHTLFKMKYNTTSFWADLNTAILWLTTSTQIDIHGLDTLDTKQWYLLIANHKSWADIILLYQFFRHKAPPLRFFLKKRIVMGPLYRSCLLVIGFSFYATTL